MNWVDLVIIIILAVFAYTGYQQGIIKSVLSVAILLISFLVTSILSPLIYGKFISNEEFMSGLSTQIDEKLSISEYLAETIVYEDEKPEEPEENSDDIIEIINDKLHLPASVIRDIRKAVAEIEPSNVKNKVVSQVSDIIAMEIAKMVIRGICFTIIYLLLFIGIKTAADVLNIVSKLPVVYEINKAAGAGVGLVGGILVLYVIGRLMFALVSAFGFEGLGKVVEGSFFLKFI